MAMLSPQSVPFEVAMLTHVLPDLLTRIDMLHPGTAIDAYERLGEDALISIAADAMENAGVGVDASSYAMTSLSSQEGMTEGDMATLITSMMDKIAHEMRVVASEECLAPY